MRVATVLRVSQGLVQVKCPKVPGSIDIRNIKILNDDTNLCESVTGTPTLDNCIQYWLSGFVPSFIADKM